MNYTVIIIYDRSSIHYVSPIKVLLLLLLLFIIYYCEQWNYCAGLNYLFLSVVYDTTLAVVLVVVYYN